MGWVDPPEAFCTFSEILADVENYLINMALPVPDYDAINKIPATVSPLTILVH